MPNTFTNLVTDSYAALAVVSREIVGLIPSVNRDSTADRLAQGQTLRSPIAPVNTAGRNATPAMSIPPASDQTIGNRSLTITKSRAFPFSWTGAEVQALGPNILNIKQQQIAQALRAAVSEVSTDVYAALRVGASRAFGTAATTPFASDLSASAEIAKILTDNGAPKGDRHLVLGTTAGAKLRTLLNNPLNANNSLNGDLSRQGILLDSNGFSIREDAWIGNVTKGTGTGYLVNNGAGYGIGDTAITLDTGSGTIIAGDVITFAGDTNKYVVATALTSNVVTLAEPGLRATLADNVALTVGNNFVANLAFSRDFATLATRLPEVPDEGDLALFRETITDPVSGLSFELVVWPGQRMITYEVALNWGVSVMNPRHGAILLG
jgi:hypothetical protein